MKIICLGKNYPHGDGDGIPPQEPVIFLKPDSCLLHGGNPFFLPDFSREITLEAELAVRICRLGKYIDPRFAHKYYDAFTLGADFTAQDLYDRLSAAGAPADIAKGFDGAAALGRWIDKNRFADAKDVPFRLSDGQRDVMRGNSRDMVFSIDRAIGIVSRYYTLKTGDVLLTGAPAPAIRVEAGDRFTGLLGEEEVLSLKIK